MLTLTYDQAWSRDQKREAWQYILDNFGRNGEDGLGCPDDPAARAQFIDVILRCGDDVVWWVGRDSDGAIRQVRPFRVEDGWAIILSHSVDPAFETDDNYAESLLSMRRFTPALIGFKTWMPEDRFEPVRARIAGQEASDAMMTPIPDAELPVELRGLANWQKCRFEFNDIFMGQPYPDAPA